MPFPVNGTNVSSSAQNVNSSVSNVPNHTHTNTVSAGWSDSSNNLGYGVGRLLRAAFDHASGAWQNWWNPGPSFEEIAIQKQHKIYRQGLEECAKHLDRAVDNLRKNPKNPESLKRIEKLALHYSAYVKRASSADLQEHQQRLFQGIEEKIAKLRSPDLKRTLTELLPIGSLKTRVLVDTQEDTKELNDPLPAPSVVNKRSVMQESFPAVFDLNALDGTNGFTTPGIAIGGRLGSSVSSAGDINGDDVRDFVLGAYGVNSNLGVSYVVFGSRSGFPAVFNLSSLNGSNGFSIPGVASNGYLGWSVSSAGDINGDGVTDFVLGAYGVNSNLGASYVLFGSRSGFPAVFDLNSLNGSNGFTIPGVATGGNLGYSISSAGDINGDSVTDLVLGAFYANSSVGTSYVVFGSRSGFPAVFNLTTLNGSNGFTIPGIAVGRYLGISVSSAGDINGDSVADLVLGASESNSFLGASYVVFGSRSSFPAVFNLSSLNGSNGFRIPGVASNGYLGVSVSSAGDINGDSVTDFVLGASVANSNLGVSYVVFGSRSAFPAVFNLSSLNGSNGFTIPGVAMGGKLGEPVSSAGDINGDNLTDLVLVARYANSGLGASYVLFGSRSGFPAVFNLSSLNGSNGFTIPGVATGGELGFSVSSAGDINGDTVTDLVLGAYNANSGLGSSYVIFGKNAFSVSTPTPTPTPALMLTACQSTQPLMLGNHAIQMSQGQNLRLTPNDLSASCGNNTAPYLGTEFRVRGLVHGRVEIRNVSGFWNAEQTFFGNDLARGNVALLHDNSVLAPELNVSMTDGQTVLETTVSVDFNETQSSIEVSDVFFEFNANGVTVLSPDQFRITNTNTKLSNTVISVSLVEGGYFTLVDEPLKPIMDFTYYQLETGQIQFVHKGSSLPNITLNVGDGTRKTVLKSPLVEFFKVNDEKAQGIPLGVVLGAIGGTVGVGLAIFGIFKFRQDQNKKVQMAEIRKKSNNIEYKEAVANTA